MGRVCSWCGVVRIPDRRHRCAPEDLARQQRTTSERTTSERTTSERTTSERTTPAVVAPDTRRARGFTVRADRIPRGTGKRGSIARGVVLTELGWAQVSADVLRRIGR